MIKKWLAKLCAWYLGKYSPIIGLVKHEPSVWDPRCVIGGSVYGQHWYMTFHNSEIVPPEFKITR